MLTITETEKALLVPFSMLTNLPVPDDLCVDNPISHLLTVRGNGPLADVTGIAGVTGRQLTNTIILDKFE